MSLPPDLVLPGSLTIRNVAAACLVSVGADGVAAGSVSGARPGGANVSDGRPSEGIGELAGELRLPEARAICLVLVDGLGAQQLSERSGHFPFLRSLRGQTQTLSSIVPSTTAAAITSLGTGRFPGETGMLGYTVFEPDSRQLMNLLQWDDDVMPMESWQRCLTLAQQSEQPSRFVSIGPQKFEGSGLTRAAFGGARVISAESLPERVDAAVGELRKKTADIVYLHWGNLDHTGHGNGSNSWQWGDEASLVDSELARLRKEMPSDCLLVVTADHGMVDVEWSVDAAGVPALRQGVDIISGEPRAMHVHTAEPDAVLERWQNYLGDRAWAVLRDEAIDSLFAPLDPRFIGSIGNVVVFMRGRNVVVDSRTQTPASLGLIGVHGSLTESEMLIPLVVV